MLCVSESERRVPFSRRLPASARAHSSEPPPSRLRERSRLVRQVLLRSMAASLTPPAASMPARAQPSSRSERLRRSAAHSSRKVSSRSSTCAGVRVRVRVRAGVRVGVGVGVGMRVRLSVSSRTATRKPDRALARASTVRYACSKQCHSMRTVHCHASIRCARSACSGRPRPRLGQG